MFGLQSNLDHALQKLKASRGTQIIVPQQQPLYVGGAVPQSSVRIPYASSQVIHAGRSSGRTMPYGMERHAQANTIFTQPSFYSPLHTPQNWQLPSKRRETYMWCRYFYENEPKVGAAIDFYSHFPMCGFETQCPDSRLKRIFDNLNKKLNLDYWTPLLSKERILLGDVFPFLEIECSICNGSGIDNQGYVCEHPGGSFGRMVVMNPDWIDVQTNVLADEPVVTLLPDDELKKTVWYKQPKAIYDRLPQHIRSLILSGRPIPLSNDSVSHLKYNPYPYGVYGVSMIRRLFKTLSYKDKLMTAQWIVAERLILPIRIVKVGEADRPAGPSDISDIQNQLAQVVNDPNLTLVTHHALDYEWVGCLTTDDNNSHVLTKDGLKHFTKITENDLIATWDKNTGKIEYQKYIRKVIFPYTSHNSNGFAYRISNRFFSFDTTPNHRHYMADGSIKRSDELAIGDNLLRQSSWKHDGIVPEVMPYDHMSEFRDFTLEDFCRFVGYYISQGHVKLERNKNLHENRLCIGLTQSIDSPIYNDMSFLMNKISTTMWIVEDTEGNVPYHQFMIGNAGLARWIADSFGDESNLKKIPQWMLDLPSEYLNILFGSMTVANRSIKGGIQEYRTSSLTLRDNICELMLKTGKSPRISHKDCKSNIGKDCRVYRIVCSERCEDHIFEITKVDVIPFEGAMWCLEMPNGNFFVQAGKQIILTGNTAGRILQLTNEYELIDKEILQGLMLTEALLSGTDSGYQSAAIGAEALVQRLEQWRLELARWIEDKIYKPYARMRALAGDKSFIDEEQTKEFGELDSEPIYRYPKIKWNDLNIRDDAQQKQLWMQLHDKGVMSAESLCEKFNIDYDQEVERTRFETAIAQMSSGQPGGSPAAPPGMGGGDMGLGGGGGAMPPAPGTDMGTGMNAEMGGGLGTPPGGDMGNGAPAPSMASASNFGGSSGKILSKDKAKRMKVPEEEAVQPSPVRLTSLEQIMAKAIMSMNIPFKTIVQCPIGRYRADFAILPLKIAIECDGAYWHNHPEAQAYDQKRDADLSNFGWTVVRFSERELKESLDAVKKTIVGVIRKNWARELEKRKQQVSVMQEAKASIGTLLSAHGIDERLNDEDVSPIELTASMIEETDGQADQGQGNQVG